jgi:hypothetical protein
MKKIKEFTPFEGENVLTLIEGNAWNDNPNPFVQIIMFLVKIVSFILGIRSRAYIIVTDRRIVQVDKNRVLWLIPVAVSVLTLNKSSIQSFGWEMASSWLIFRKYFFVLENQAGRVKITYSGGKEKLIEDCRILDSVVSQK